jgi:hypothetical protein
MTVCSSSNCIFNQFLENRKFLCAGVAKNPHSGLKRQKKRAPRPVIGKRELPQALKA